MLITPSHLEQVTERAKQKLEKFCLNLHGKKVALLLSGGLDSGICHRALVHSGVKFDTYTISFGEFQNRDTIIAEQRHSLLDGFKHGEFFRYKVPRTYSVLERAALYYGSHAGQAMKSQIEVLALLRPVVKKLVNDYDHIIHTVSSGTLWGAGKECAFARSRGGRVEWEEKRRSDFEWEYDGAPPQLSRMFRKDYPNQWVDLLTVIREEFFEMSWFLLHGRGMKTWAFDLYPELKKLPHVMSGAQVEAGVREFAQAIASERGQTPLTLYGQIIKDNLGFAPKGTTKINEWKHKDEMESVT